MRSEINGDGDCLAWTRAQKPTAVEACRCLGMDDADREFLLRQFPASIHDGRPTSTSPRLTNADFEQFMAILESRAGGALRLSRRVYDRGYWQAKAQDGLQRFRHRILNIACCLEQRGDLAAGGVGLAGWIEHRVSGGRTNTISELTMPELRALHTGLTSFARPHGVHLPS